MLILVVVSGMVWLIASFSLDFEHARDINMMGLKAAHLVFARRFFHIFVNGILEDDAVQFGKIDVFALWIIGQ